MGSQGDGSLQHATTGTPVTKIENYVRVLEAKDIVLKDFKVPPKTPKRPKQLTWRLGSGFEGLTWDTSDTHAKGSRGRKKGQRPNSTYLDAPIYGMLQLSVMPSVSYLADSISIPANR